MADQARVELRRGTAIVFGVTGATVAGQAVTNNITLTSLAAGSGRMSVEADLTANMPRYLDVIAVTEPTSAPTAGGTVDYYLAGSHDGTNYANGVTGADAAWPIDGNEDEHRVMLGDAYSLIATNDSIIQQQQCYRIEPPGRYISCVCDNNLSVALSAATHEGGLIVYPVYEYIVDP